MTFTLRCKSDQLKFKRSDQPRVGSFFPDIQRLSSVVYLVLRWVVVVLCLAVGFLICCGYFCRRPQHRQTQDLWLKPELQAPMDSLSQFLLRSLTGTPADAQLWTHFSHSAGSIELRPCAGYYCRYRLVWMLGIQHLLLYPHQWSTMLAKAFFVSCAVRYPHSTPKLSSYRSFCRFMNNLLPFRH